MPLSAVSARLQCVKLTEMGPLMGNPSYTVLLRKREALALLGRVRVAELELRRSALDALKRAPKLRV